MLRNYCGTNIFHYTRPNISEGQENTKMDQTKLEPCFLIFFLSSFHQFVPYGTRDSELDSGETILIPDVVRTACHSFIIEMYEKHSKDTGF